MGLTPKELKQFAPLLRFHPKEKYFPMDPIEFIKTSRFRHHRGAQRDQGFNVRLSKWIDGDKKSPEYYNPPITYLNAFTPWTRGENRRPLDPGSGNHWNVFLEPDGKPKGDHNPTGTIPVFYYQRNIDTSRIKKSIRDQYDIKVAKYLRVSYWWFQGFNDAPTKLFDHQGDWEHVTAIVVKGKLSGVYFAGHEGPPRWVEKSKLTIKNNRVVVYCARGTHASYPHAGKFNSGIDITGNGYEWDTGANLAALVSQPWRDYAGAWGKVGKAAWSTGPLGPWHKRHKA
jgi:hypothetical protein